MNLEELKVQVARDLPIKDDANLATEALHNQELLAKYLNYKTNFELLMHKSKGEYKRLYRDKWEYYGGKSDAKIYAAKPFDIKVLKTDLGVYINSDEDIINIELKIEYYETLLQFIDGIIKSIDNRSWDIKHAQDWKKFVAGGF